MLILTTDWENVNARCQFRTNAGAANTAGVINEARDRLLSHSSQMEERPVRQLVPALGFYRFAQSPFLGPFMVQ